MTQRWDAARAANKPKRKYKEVGPVGSKLSYYDNKQDRDHMWLALGDADNTKDALSCRGCGVHECACTVICEDHHTLLTPGQVKTARDEGLMPVCMPCRRDDEKLKAAIDRIKESKAKEEAEVALRQREANERALREQETRITCNYCGSGCTRREYSMAHGKCPRCGFHIGQPTDYDSMRRQSLGHYDSMQAQADHQRRALQEFGNWRDGYGLRRQNQENLGRIQRERDTELARAQYNGFHAQANPPQSKCNGVGGKCILENGHDSIHIVTDARMPIGQMGITDVQSAQNPTKLSELFRQWVVKEEGKTSDLIPEQALPTDLFVNPQTYADLHAEHMQAHMQMWNQMQTPEGMRKAAPPLTFELINEMMKRFV